MKKKKFSPVLGARFEVDGVLCELRVINRNRGWLFPVVDDPDDVCVRRYIAYGKVNGLGKVVKL